MNSEFYHNEEKTEEQKERESVTKKMFTKFFKGACQTFRAWVTEFCILLRVNLLVNRAWRLSRTFAQPFILRIFKGGIDYFIWSNEFVTCNLQWAINI